MENNQICIWGPREGLEIIFSNNEVWEAYLLENRNLFDSKFHNLILLLDKEFYYLSKINGYQVFSVVSPYRDSLQRDTFIGISIICKLGLSFGSDLIDALNSMLKQYLDNPSEINKMKDQANSLKPIASNYGYEQNNCVITIDDDTLFQNEFGKFKGDTAYFIYPNSEASVLNRLPQTLYSLKNLVSNKPNTHDLVQLRNCIHTKTNLPLAKSLFEKLQQWLNAQEQNRYADWNREEEIKKQPADPKAPIPAPNPTPVPAPNPTPNPVPNPPDEKQELEVIKSLISEAKANQWKTDPSSIKILLGKNAKLQARLSSSEINDLKEWEKTFDTAEEKECDRLLTQLYQKIKKASKTEIKKNVTTLKVEVTSLENRILSLNNKEPKAKLRALEQFKYLSSKVWIPVNRKPLYLKLAATFLILALTVAGYFSFKNLRANSEKMLAEETADYDHDGIKNKADQEDKTIWLKDTTKYKLVKYVDHLGKVDGKKTKPLCDCWEFPKIADRAILLCQDNKNWFMFNKELYEFREDAPGDGRFYNSQEKRMESGKDDLVEKHHQQKFPQAYGENPDLDPVVVSGYSNITYKGKTYSIKSEFLSNEGAYYNEARWKFKNNTFQKQNCITDTQNGRGAWNNASKADIDVILKKFGTLKVDEEVDKRVDEEDEEPKTPTDHSDYWLRLDLLPINELKGRKEEITQNKLDSNYKCPIGSPGDLARASVLAKIK
jgi:hypothetical protein